MSFSGQAAGHADDDGIDGDDGDDGACDDEIDEAGGGSACGAGADGDMSSKSDVEPASAIPAAVAASLNDAPPESPDAPEPMYKVPRAEPVPHPVVAGSAPETPPPSTVDALALPETRGRFSTASAMAGAACDNAAGHTDTAAARGSPPAAETAGTAESAARGVDTIATDRDPARTAAAGADGTGDGTGDGEGGPVAKKGGASKPSLAETLAHFLTDYPPEPPLKPGREYIADHLSKHIHRTPAHTFMHYAPHTFAELRRQSCISPDEYKASISSLVAKGLGAGKSGASFWCSADGRLIVKTLTRGETRELRGGLSAYVGHIRRFPHSLIGRVIAAGKLGAGNSAVRVMVMVNVLHIDSTSGTRGGCVDFFFFFFFLVFMLNVSASNGLHTSCLITHPPIYTISNGPGVRSQGVDCWPARAAGRDRA
jgi:hypothetical protein